MLASLASGASCGPANPLQQLGKTYAQDRGAQQDHFGPQAGPSNAPFRQSTPTTQPHDPSSSAFFQPAQPLDLQNLQHALPPAASAAAPPWAQAFAAQNPSASLANSAHEQEMFARAFGRSQPQQQPMSQQHDWRAEYSQQHRASTPLTAGSAPLASTGPAPSMSMQHPGMARLQGQGFIGMPMGGMAGHAAPREDVRTQAGVETMQEDKSAWENAFLSQLDKETQTSNSIAGITETRPLTPPLRAHSPLADPAARDALAQTAADLLETVRSAEARRTQPERAAVAQKLANSSFMQLMHQLKDGQTTVEGDTLVSRDPSTNALEQGLDKGKGRLRDDGWASDFAATVREPVPFDEREEEGRVNSTAPAPLLRPGQPVSAHAREQHEWAQRQASAAQYVRELEDGYRSLRDVWDEEDHAREERAESKPASSSTAGFFQGDGGVFEIDEGMRASTHVPLAQSSWEEDFDDPSLIVGGHALGGGPRTRTAPSAQQQEWDALQSSWDEIEATSTAATGPQVNHSYPFTAENPYLPSTTTHHHAHHASLASALNDRHASLLQHEAEVQLDPQNASAWLSLGVKQQQNEREDLAIAALQHALQLDPSVGDGAAHLALAVSYSNEGRRGETYEALHRWTDSLVLNPIYANEIDQYRNLLGSALPDSPSERVSYLSNLLIRLAQVRAERVGAGDVDADVQMALGVLFNASEEYEKAGDCFEAALSVRPQDPLLYNRLGATHANSGKTDLAKQYYSAALDLDAGYVRARYNLAVASMNTGQYEEAVQQLLTALSVQEAESEKMQDAPAPPSQGRVSHALWDSLHVALLQMHRSDLVGLSSERNLRGLLQAFAATE
ncbi:tetratricopeptide repeat protein [Rhodotorula paludigena]|uniref:tetratricopeptide repeat protein n=1 Tax=Rhodotorula paludigena TaxID=86838 RepID=UPI00317E71C6